MLLQLYNPQFNTYQNLMNDMRQYAAKEWQKSVHRYFISEKVPSKSQRGKRPLEKRKLAPYLSFYHSLQMMGFSLIICVKKYFFKNGSCMLWISIMMHAELAIIFAALREAPVNYYFYEGTSIQLPSELSDN